MPTGIPESIFCVPAPGWEGACGPGHGPGAAPYSLPAAEGAGAGGEAASSPLSLFAPLGDVHGGAAGPFFAGGFARPLFAAAAGLPGTVVLLPGGGLLLPRETEIHPSGGGVRRHTDHGKGHAEGVDRPRPLSGKGHAEFIVFVVVAGQGLHGDKAFHIIGQGGEEAEPGDPGHCGGKFLPNVLVHIVGEIELVDVPLGGLGGDLGWGR